MTKISEALEYTLTLVNQRTDEDGYYGAQCVDLPMHLTQKYFGMRTWGNAIDYTGNAQPLGTVRLYNIDEAQPMDYFVLNGAGGYGHIGVIIEVDGDHMLTLEQNLAGDLDNGSPAVFREWSKASMRNAFECLIRLPFEDDLNGLQVGYKIDGEAHIQNHGWQKINNGMIGTTGQALRLESFSLTVTKNGQPLNVSGAIHVQDVGDVESKLNLFGTVGMSKRIEAIKIDVDAPLEYRVHVEDIGWSDWQAIGTWIGTKGQAKRIEAIEFKIV